MSEYVADTPVVIPMGCPDCDPDRDERTYDVRYCSAHEPGREGMDDVLVRPLAYMSGTAEVGGDDNARWCAMLHRGRA